MAVCGGGWVDSELCVKKCIDSRIVFCVLLVSGTQDSDSNGSTL